MAVTTHADADRPRNPAGRAITRQPWARRSYRPFRRNLLAWLLAALAVTAVLAAGCATSSGSGGAAKPAKVSLTFTTVGFSGKSPGRWTLTCDPAGGTHQAAPAACAALLPLHHPFAPQPAGMACPMILRSDRKYIVSGTWFGVKVHRTVVDGGCDMDLFSKLDKIFN